MSGHQRGATPDVDRPAARRGLRLLRPAESTDGDRAERLAEQLELAGRGDQAAFGRVYDDTAGMVYGIVLRVIRSPEQAEEITQEVYVELWRLAGRFDRSRGSVRGWVATVAHRRAVDRVRSEQSRRNREDRQASRVEREHDSVSEAVVDSLERDQVAAALHRLTPVQRQAIELAYHGGHTYREVATQLGIAEGTAKTRIRDGLIRLRDELGVVE